MRTGQDRAQRPRALGRDDDDVVEGSVLGPEHAHGAADVGVRQLLAAAMAAVDAEDAPLDVAWLDGG